MRVKFTQLVPNAKLPQHQTPGSAGADLSVIVQSMGDYLAPGQIKEFSTGLSVTIADGYELQIRSRSSKALQGLIVLNAPGTIDSDYQGEIKLILQNVSGRGMNIVLGDRVAQVVLSKYERIDSDDVETVQTELPETKPTKRRQGGLGSTGR